MKAMLSKRNGHPVLREMAALFGEEPFGASKHYRNTLYFPKLKAFMRADGMKPEDVAEMLSLEGCEKIILFPYFPLDEKSAYYELTLAVPRTEFADFMNRVQQHRADRLREAITEANERSTASNKSVLRVEEKSNHEIVERI